MNLINVKGSMSTASRKSDDAASDQFPAGLRVLVVDDDPTCLMIVERMLKRCHYEVTTCNRAEKALASLQANRNGFDIVISDVHMPDMDGFKLLELIGLEMDLPVIMMSADDGKSVVMKGVTHGACDYLIKPIRIEELKNIWQHVVRKRKSGWKEVEQSASVDDGDRQHNNKHSEDADYTSSATEGSWKSSKRRKDEEDEFEDKDDSSALKKPRVVWSIELHQQFVAAVNQLGIDKAVPKKIMELMNVPGLTRENVASHLQKYRLYLRRLSGVSHHHGGSFINPQDACFGPISGLDLQTLAFAGHLPLQASGFDRSSPKSSISVPLINQRNTIFSFDNSKLRFGDVQQQPSIIGNCKPLNLLHGVPTTLEPKQLASLHQMQGQTQSRVPQLPVNILQPNGSQTASSTNYMRFPMSLHRTELPGNSFPVMIAPNLTSKARYQEEVKGSGEGFMSANYMLDELQQIQSSKGWEFQNMGTTFDAASSHHNNSGNIHSCQTNLLVQHHQGLSSSRQRDGYVISNNVSGGGMTSFTAEGSQNLNNHVGCLAKVKSEVVPDTVGPALLFQDHFGQEDLMSVLLKQL